MTCQAIPNGAPCTAPGSPRVLLLGETPVAHMTLCRSCEAQLTRLLGQVRALAGLPA